MNRPVNRTTTLRVASSLAVAAGLGLVALAGRAGAEPPHHGPPPEAFTACDGKARGDTCSVQFHDTAVQGTCDAPPDASKLACRPNHPPPPPPPPPEAFTACDGKARGDTCSVQFHDTAVQGTCDAPPDAGKLACRPNGPPPAPPSDGR
ncbi:Hypothetical protein A7982_08745 [Minicystis rosea]|nr:Hypothetical protein A7982_08745 [Minicystis rosea]